MAKGTVGSFERVRELICAQLVERALPYKRPGYAISYWAELRRKNRMLILVSF